MSTIRQQIAEARQMIANARNDIDRIEIFCAISEPTPNDALLMMRAQSDASTMQPVIDMFQQLYAATRTKADEPISPGIAAMIRDSFRDWAVRARLDLDELEYQLDAAERHPSLRNQ